MNLSRIAFPRPYRSPVWFGPALLVGSLLGYLAVIFALAYQSIPLGVRLVIAALPVIAAGMIWRMISRAIRGSDELEKQIHLRAAARLGVFLIIYLLGKDLWRSFGVPVQLESVSNFQPLLDPMFPIAIAIYAGAYIRSCWDFHPDDFLPVKKDATKESLVPQEGGEA